MSDSTETTTVEPLKPRVGTIVWGAVLLVVAAVTLFASQVDVGAVTPEAVVWSVVAFGAVLVLAGIATAVVRAARNDRAQS
jgi:predicted phage tail protein